MNKQEFIQEAALRLINRPDMPLADIAGAARELADQLFPGVPAHKGNPETDSIAVLLKEVQRVEDQKVNEQKKRSNVYRQRGGLDIRLHNFFISPNNIETVGDLLRHGRRELQKGLNIGPHTVECVDQALQNLYGITEW